MSWDPSAPSERDTEYDGFLSYATEWHALTIGAGVGLIGGLMIDTEYAIAGIVPMTTIIVLAIEIEIEKLTKEVNINSLVKREIRKEPWYAIGGSVMFFLIGLFTNLYFGI